MGPLAAMTDRWSATERIFHAALERPVEARAAFLAEACGGDDALRRDVQSLLDEASATGFLEQPALQVAAGLVTSASLAPLTGQRTRRLSHHRAARPRRHGRGLSRARYEARSRRGDQDPAAGASTTDPDRLARFEREARVLASLNHPHIGAIYGLEESGRARCALVLELVEGETLADRIARGPVPLKEALTIARQIADALDAAHEKGIVHRDLKPANIKITPDGVVKVLDFGLAQAYGAATRRPASRASPTITVDGRRRRHLGTAAYMSPEQARGQPVDKRADIWAFGCVLYEMLTGRAGVCRGDGVRHARGGAATVSRTGRRCRPAMPPAVTTLLRRCLEKDVRRRLRDIGDVRAELDDALAQPVVGARRPMSASGARGVDPAAVVLAVAGVVARCRARRVGRSMGVCRRRSVSLVRSALQADHRRRRHGGDAGGLARRQGRRVRGDRQRPAPDLDPPAHAAAMPSRSPTMTSITTIRAGRPTRAPSCTSRHARRKAKPARSGRSRALGGTAAAPGGVLDRGRCQP